MIMRLIKKPFQRVLQYISDCRAVLSGLQESEEELRQIKLRKKRERQREIEQELNPVINPFAQPVPPKSELDKLSNLQKEKLALKLAFREYKLNLKSTFGYTPEAKKEENQTVKNVKSLDKEGNELMRELVKEAAKIDKTQAKKNVIFYVNVFQDALEQLLKGFNEGKEEELKKGPLKIGDKG
eukprot:augustus_masked-scaffold_8-processed-gene-3.7-mRNA-1 protein AED:1.00 eAED:1.00 QI:0/-1/0/0/-1/1/1/0/182